MASPRFSVIIAVYNGANTIARAIESVLSQTCAPLELIVVDDGSTDATADIVSGYSDRLVYLYQENAGVSVARNRGVERARGDWIAFLDADDWYYPDRLQLHADWISQDPALDFLTGDFEYVEPDGTKIRSSMAGTRAGSELLKSAGDGHRIIMQGDILGQFVEQHFGDTHTLSLPRDTFLRIGGYPPGIAVCEDVNMLIRLCAASSRAGVICSPMAAYVIYPDSATRADPVLAQQRTVEALLPLRRQLATATKNIRRGLCGAIRKARLDFAYSLLKRGRRWSALWAVFPLLYEHPGWRSVKDCLSVIKGPERV